MTIHTTQTFNKVLAAFTITLAIWLILVYAPLYSAVEIWFVNEIYNHCFLVIPASIYLIYEKRFQIKWSDARMSWLALFFLSGQLLFYTLGTAADIQLFQHIAIFSMLPTLVWLFVGNTIAWQLKFPLLFVLFSIPVGEELIPFLQEVTADISVWMLELTGIPLFRSGLFIQIPQGKFVVAEACSGVSFLIASIVLGSLYAHMNLVSMRRRWFFVLLSVVFPILANAVRVYGIIYIGYKSDMTHAVGADHLIYGWFFFAFVLVCLFLLGEAIRRHEIRKQGTNDLSVVQTKIGTEDASKRVLELNHAGIKTSLLVVLALLIISTHLQNFRMSNIELSGQAGINLAFDEFSQVERRQSITWVPRYVNSSKEEMLYLRHEDLDFDVYYAYFDGSGGEVVSSLNRLYEQERWTLVENTTGSVNTKSYNKQIVGSSLGTRKVLSFWYLVDGNMVRTKTKVKLHQLVQRLKGQQSHSAIIAVSVELNELGEPKHTDVENLIGLIMQKVSIDLK